VAIRHASSTTIEDCDISSPSVGAGRLMVGIKDIYGDASGAKVIGNNIWHTSTGVQMGAGLIQDNYIHDLGLTGQRLTAQRGSRRGGCHREPGTRRSSWLAQP
jgi:hypothetical protein